MSDNLTQLHALFKQLSSRNIVYNKAYYKLTNSFPGAVLLSHLSYLYSEVFNSTEFYQTDAQIMDTLGFSEKCLRNAKKSIKKYVSVVKRGLPAKNHWTIKDILIYDLIAYSPIESSSAQKGPTGAAQKGPTGAAQKGPTNKQELQRNNNLKNNKTMCVLKDDKSLSSDKKDVATEEDVIQVMDKLWEAYPVRVKKKPAYTALLKILRGKPRDEALKLATAIWEGLNAKLNEHQAKVNLKQQGANIFVPNLPHLVTWLSQEGWEDEHQKPEDILAGATRKPGILNINNVFGG